ncbi:MAG: hypothetical protein K6A97_06970 [Lachnospiraceae bacterium]|nr:hypothetical protein [Lachnospiraceae bacterium]
MKKKVLKRVCSTAMGALMFVCLPLSAFAREIDVTSLTEGLSIDLANETEDLILSGTNTQNGSVELIAVSGTDKTVILRNLSLDSSETYYGEEDRAALSVVGTGNIIFELDGTNILKSGCGRAGLQKQNDGTLTIKDDNGTSGSLEAIGGNDGAGIGGKSGESGSDIIIKGGTITATGGECGAGIGGGENASGSNIIIEGGTITATGGANGGAGIGGGKSGNGSNITIKDGTVNAEAGTSASGIGGGAGGDGIDINIEDGTITAIGDDGGAGIGGGESSIITNPNIPKKGGDGINITISGGNVTAKGSIGGGAGIGGGTAGSIGKVEISGGSIIAVGAAGAGIGGGLNAIGDVTITGGNIIAVSGSEGAGIGGGSYSNGSSITISNDAIVYAAGGAGDLFMGIGEGAAIGEGGTNSNPSDTDNGVPVNGIEVLDISGLYDTGSVTVFAAGTTVEEIKANPGNGVTVRRTIPDPNKVTEPETTSDETNKETFKNEQPPKEEPPVYTERSCIADVNVAALITAALKADPNAKEINIEFGDNICLTPDIMKDLFADNRVAKNCMFSHEGKRYVLRINAVDTASATYADCFEVLKKEPGGLAGFKRMAQIFEVLNVTLKELDQ